MVKRTITITAIEHEVTGASGKRPVRWWVIEGEHCTTRPDVKKALYGAFLKREAEEVEEGDETQQG